MIIYGSRMYFKKNVVTSVGRCEHCGKFGKQTSYDGRKFGHLYFIPLIPEGGRVRVLRECKSCQMGIQMPYENLENVLANVRETLNQAIVAIGAGEETFTMGDQEVNSVGSIAVNLEDYYCLCGESTAKEVIGNLRAIGAEREASFGEAKIAETAGKWEAATQHYRTARDFSEHTHIEYHFAQYLSNTGKSAEAIPIAEKVERQLVEDLSVKQLLIDCYEVQKDWNKMVGTYENSFLIIPELKSDKNIYKKYKKACKKAGRAPQP